VFKLKKCVYCSKGLGDDIVVDVCDICGVGVWGNKMFQAIKDNMENARDAGDLNQGSVGENIKDMDNFS
jgi:hypothetical protein